MKPEPGHPHLYIDIETYSTTDLKKYGVYPYAADPEFLILMCAWGRSDVPGRPITVAIGEDAIRAIPGLTDPDVVKVAHNAQFERICFSRFFNLPTGEYLPPEEWLDTAVLAAEVGLPQRLELLGPALKIEEKDEAGTALINYFCKPYRGRRRLPEDSPVRWADFVMYCQQDVETMVEALDKLPAMTPTEWDVYVADQKINDRGIVADVALAHKAVDAALHNRIVNKREVRELTGIENPNSQQQMLKWLTGPGGLQCKNLKKETVEAELAAGDVPEVTRRVLELRQQLALSASAKYETIIASVGEDGRLRGQFRFFGAHTGRWAGRGVQLHNLPRAGFAGPTQTAAAVADLQLGLGADPATLKKLVRPTLVGPFTVVDYSAIEARVIAWLSGEQWALDAFAEGRDIYVETAERMSSPGNKLDRAAGKVAVLALGYQGGANSLRAMGAQGSDEHLDMLKVQWRRANQHIVALWDTLDTAMKNLKDDTAEITPRLSMTRRGRRMRLHLPSGRYIGYHDLRFENYTVEVVPGRWVKKSGYRYRDPKSTGRIPTYGGRLAENVTQAVARDILAEALVRLENSGYRVVGHVHDEILVEGEHDVEEITRVMCVNPTWADGLPLNGEGFRCTRYQKG